MVEFQPIWKICASVKIGSFPHFEGWKFQEYLKPPPKCYQTLTNWDDPPSNPWKGAGLWYFLWHYSPHAPFVQIWIISAFQGVKIPNMFETTSQLFTTFVQRHHWYQWCDHRSNKPWLQMRQSWCRPAPTPRAWTLGKLGGHRKSSWRQKNGEPGMSCWYLGSMDYFTPI